jgi:hypothetical protein
MRFLITSLQTYESEFYGVGRELERRGHSVVHVAESPRAARELRSHGVDGRAVQDVIAELAAPVDLEQQVRRIEATYPIPHLRDVYRNDKACQGQPEEWCVRRTVDRFRALERVVAEAKPDVALPEVGNETIGSSRTWSRTRTRSRCSSSCTRSSRTPCASTSTRSTRRSRRPRSCGS